MKENEKNQGSISYPPSWCGAICRNAMSEKCVEFCAVYRNCSHFELKKGINIIDFPRVPVKDFRNLTKHEKATYLAVCVEKILDHLQGVTDEPEYRPIARPDPYSKRSFPIPSHVKIQDILPHIAEEVSSLQDTEECSSETISTDEMVRGED